MLKEYSVSEILDLSSQHIPYFVGTFEDTEDGDVEWPHRHDFYSLVWFTQGSGFYVIDMQEYEIVPNRMFLVSPKQIHNWDYSQNSKGYILICDSTLALELNLNDIASYLDIVDNKSFIKDIFIQLSQFRSQFRGIANNYNQLLRLLKEKLGEKKALAFLYKLEKATIELVHTNHEIENQIQKLEELWLLK